MMNWQQYNTNIVCQRPKELVRIGEYGNGKWLRINLAKLCNATRYSGH
jgi:hypothetical protein